MGDRGIRSMDHTGAGSQTNLTQIGRFARPPSGNLGSTVLEHSLVTTMADRIGTGCVYDVQLPGTFGLLVTRDDPRTRWRARPVLAPIHTHWPLLAPSIYLLTGHRTVCRSRRCRRMGRCQGPAPLTLGWPAFATSY